MPGLLTFTDDNFEAEVLGSVEPVVVDFWADTCAPCRLMLPVVRRLALVLGPRAKVGRLHVFENPATTEALAIKGIPYLVVVREGAIVLEVIGDRSFEELSARVVAVV